MKFKDSFFSNETALFYFCVLSLTTLQRYGCFYDGKNDFCKDNAIRKSVQIKKTVFLHEFIHKSKTLLTAQAQQVSPRLPYLAMTLAQGIEALPQRVADSTEITFEDNGILLLRRNMELLQIEKQPVQVAVRAILRRLQLLYFPKIFPLRGWHIRALSAPGSGGTMEEGIFFAVL